MSKQKEKKAAGILGGGMKSAFVSSNKEGKRKVHIKVGKNPQRFSGQLDLYADNFAVALGKDVLALSADIALTPLTYPYSLYDEYRVAGSNPFVSCLATGVTLIVPVVICLFPALLASAIAPHGAAKEITFAGAAYLWSMVWGGVNPEICYPRTQRRHDDRANQNKRKRSKRPSMGGLSALAAQPSLWKRMFTSVQKLG